MNREWNLLPLGGFLLSLLAFFSYYFYFVDIPVTRDFPWASLLIFVGALALLGLGLRRAFARPERYRGRISGPIFATLSVALLSFFLFMNFSISRQLPASQQAPRAGQPAPDFTLPDKNNLPITLSKLWGGDPEAGTQGQWVLLVFYRGYW